MKRDTDSAWELIRNDPALRLELSAIEQQAGSEEEMVAKLVEFYSRIEGMLRLLELITEGPASCLRAG
jgi:hypothetical protein